MESWYHVTPLFSLPKIIDAGGLRCGADVEKDGLPRRHSSRHDDDQIVSGFGGLRASDCVLVFTNSSPPLLRSKIENRTGEWKAFPHVLMHFSAAACMKTANWSVFGSKENIGRTIRKGNVPGITKYSSYIAVFRSAVQEVVIPAGNLPGRLLPLHALQRVECFSPADQAILVEFFEEAQVNFEVKLTHKQKYVDAQSQPRSGRFLEMTKEYYTAFSKKNVEQCEQILRRLSDECFD